jgi:hypothetical protein
MTRIEVTDVYTRELVQSTPNVLYVFGDNTWRRGNGGQAIIRGLPNTFGIATKLKPSQEEDSYFTDNSSNLKYILDDIIKLDIIRKSNNYDVIMFPSGGLGTGLSKMPEKCPKLFDVMNDALLGNFGFDNTNGTIVDMTLNN